MTIDLSIQNAAAAPDWAKDAIWYQVFPERFRNGAPQSDPHLSDFSEKEIPGWRICPWGMEWYARDTWEVPNGENFWSTVFNRRFGGDLIGLREQLPYLQELGITAIYLNPIFMAASLHKYDATVYHHIDPTLGPDRDGDLKALAAANETEHPDTWIWTAADRYFLELVADVHARDMRIILDGVFNHSGTRCFAFQDIRKNGPQSRYWEWYTIHRWDGTQDMDYHAWDGANGSLPNFGRDGDTLNPGVKKYIFDITRRWMDPSGEGRISEGIDGWRLDVAYCVPHEFWREWHAHVRSINPEAYTTAEIVAPAQEWIQPDEFSAVMNYEWLFPTLSFFTPHPEAIGATEFKARLNELYARHTPGTALIMQNLLDSHDTGRILTMLDSQCPPFRNWDHYFNWARVAENPALKTAKPSEATKHILRLMAVWQFTGPGAPMLYYGTEVGMWGANDPCDRQPMFWADIPMDDETMGFHEPLLNISTREPDMMLFGFYQKLTHLRTNHAALRRGSFQWMDHPDEAAIAFQRAYDGERIVCVINKGAHPIDVTTLIPSEGAIDLWRNEPLVDMIVPPASFRIVQLLNR